MKEWRYVQDNVVGDGAVEAEPTRRCGLGGRYSQSWGKAKPKVSYSIMSGSVKQGSKMNTPGTDQFVAIVRS